MLLGCYRTGEANDPEVFIAAVVRVLSGYPVDIAERVADPLTGIPSRIKWLPTPSEVKEACDDLYGPRKRTQEWDERAKLQFAEREQAEAERQAQPNLAELKAKYGETYGLDPVPLKKTDDSLRQKRLQETAAYALREIEREYAARGIEPMMAGNTIISPSLVEKVRSWQADPETGDAEHRWKDYQRQCESAVKAAEQEDAA